MGVRYKMRKNWMLIGWTLFCGLLFNVTMSRGCDTLFWFVLIQIISVCIMLIPFLPDSLLNVLLSEVDYRD